ncbi:phosphotransferase enzyme family protein [Fictibacillus enclensis]|uniref:phosphotransferase enzyme family protein n=1 Tax=Fictibacillus enclensis TaxID=1017270 RepID=UPI0024C0BBA8|nr:phosphotransferase [Fictibacillus enclensis]WHY72566.1 phosphotransferase [Fictibacillus enclensis]
MDQSVLMAASDAFGLNCKWLTHIGGNVNDVYNYPAENSNPSRILRLTHKRWRNEDETAAELHFMNYLYANGVSVPKILTSQAGRWVEPATNGYHACMFVKAPGHTPVGEDWNSNMVVNWGRLIGQMHILTQSYTPLENLNRRDWKQESWMDLRQLPQKEKIVCHRATELLTWLNTLPMCSKNYGLVHCDLHARNFFVTDEGALTAFDFDDSCYHWFAYDIAVILYSVISKFNQQERKRESLDDYMSLFLSSFLKGYQEIHHFDDWWLEAMPRFLKYRRLVVYNYLHQRYDWKTADKEKKVKWLSLKAEIEADESILTI